jgi:hypothetical protein
MFYLVANGQDRPSVLAKTKDEKYHLDFARYCVGQANNEYQSNFISKVDLNKRFYKGDQWSSDEDLESFFKDETGQDRNRIKIVKNLIRPMVEQFRGNAIRMGLNFRVKSISPQAINRREEKLSEMLFLSKVANQPGNPFGDELKEKNAIGNSEAETTAIFDNLYQDAYVRKMNYLLRYVAEKNQFEEMKLNVAENLALSGIAVMKGYEYAGHQEFETVQSENFFFDRSAKKYDISDSDFMGEVLYLHPTQIFEMYPDLTSDQRNSIENYSKMYKKAAFDSASGHNASATSNNQYSASGKLPVYVVYWRDGESYEYGYVLDKFGYEYLTKINFTYEGEDKPRYTDKDLVQSKSERAKRVLKGKLKRRLYVDTLRTCHFLPNEIMASSMGTTEAKFPDIILDYGLAPYQETENLDSNSVHFPYKAYCWGYIDGEIMSPIDDAINPQRFINRILSVAENQINNSGGSGIAYDKSAVDPNGGEDELMRNMNQSKPIGFNAKGRGIQNIVSTYDNSVKSGTMVMFNIIEAMGGYMQEVTGVNEALKGESTGSDQLVGVTQLMIQRGSLMQEPFYNAITNVFKQCYQSIATVGKRIYADNERNIAIATGDEGTQIIKITRDMKLEDFRCFVKRENSDEMLVNAGNQMLLQFLQLGIIDQKRFANLFGRSTPDEIATAVRENAKEKEELARMQQKQQAQQEQAMMAEQEGMMSQQNYMMAEQQAKQDVMEMDKMKHEKQKEAIKAVAKIAPINAEAQNEILKAHKDLQK